MTYLLVSLQIACCIRNKVAHFYFNSFCCPSDKQKQKATDSDTCRISFPIICHANNWATHSIQFICMCKHILLILSIHKCTDYQIIIFDTLEYFILKDSHFLTYLIRHCMKSVVDVDQVTMLL